MIATTANSQGTWRRIASSTRRC